MNFLYMAHSGLRYLVLLAGALATAWFLVGAIGRRPAGAAARAFGGAFAGVLDLQIVLGLSLVAMGRFSPPVIGHIAMMSTAAVLLHVLLVSNRRRARPGYLLPLLGSAGALVLIVGGILAIGRPLLGSGAVG